MSGCATVGTSVLVYPAAGLPIAGAQEGACVAQINPRPTDIDALTALNVRGTAAEILPALVAAAWPEEDARKLDSGE